MPRRIAVFFCARVPLHQVVAYTACAAFTRRARCCVGFSAGIEQEARKPGTRQMKLVSFTACVWVRAMSVSEWDPTRNIHSLTLAATMMVEIAGLEMWERV